MYEVFRRWTLRQGMDLIDDARTIERAKHPNNMREKGFVTMTKTLVARSRPDPDEPDHDSTGSSVCDGEATQERSLMIHSWRHKQERYVL